MIKLMSRFIENKKAHFNYEILDKFEAGIELRGFEVKSIRKKQGSLEGSYVIVRGGEAYLINVRIPPYQPHNTPLDYEPARNRRLFLRKDEIAELASVKKGLTIVPLSMYSKGRHVKVEIAVARGKKKYDKREVLKKRESDREIRRELLDR